jgi:hypothetical protein
MKLLAPLLAAVSATSNQVIVGLKQPTAGVVRLEKLFWEVADPENTLEFGKHRTLSDITEFVAASDGTKSRVFTWLTSSAGLNASKVTLSPTQDTVTAKVPDVCCPDGRAPPIPKEQAQDIDFILLESLGKPSKKSNDETNVKSHLKDSSMGLSAQKTAYGVPFNLTGHNKANRQMVWGTGTYGYSQDDLQLFYSTYCPHCNAKAVKFDKDNIWNGKVHISCL